MAKQQSFGRAIALKFAGNGAAVRILDLNPNDAD
jgi:NAD(P)-dependent dehydrogenase (short-subunit alcohol dehydrogenase family)